MIIDTHAHIADKQFDADRAEVVARAKAAGLGAVIEIADNEAEWARARTLAEAFPSYIWWTVGFHPHHADQADPGLRERMREALRHAQAVAVGEIGLDYFRNPVPREVQLKTFESLLLLAMEEDKPMVIHCREADKSSRQAQDDLLKIFQKYLVPPPPEEKHPPVGVLHCFQGNSEFAAACSALGFMFGVDGPLTYPKAEDLRAVFSGLPLDSIVLETDSPYLPPQNRRGQRNEPSYLPAVAEELARLKNLPLDEVHRLTTQNARRLYRINFIS